MAERAPKSAAICSFSREWINLEFLFLMLERTCMTREGVAIGMSRWVSYDLD